MPDKPNPEAVAAAEAIVNSYQSLRNMSADGKAKMIAKLAAIIQAHWPASPAEAVEAGYREAATVCALQNGRFTMEAQRAIDKSWLHSKARAALGGEG